MVHSGLVCPRAFRLGLAHTLRVPKHAALQTFLVKGIYQPVVYRPGRIFATAI